MSKKALAIIAVILLAAASGFAYLLAQPEEQKTVQTAAPPASQPEAPGPAAASAGSYVDYREGIIAETEGTKILFFHAPWCPQCRQLEASIKSDGVPAGVTIIKVDYDSMTGLRQKYGVAIQTTLVKVDDAGNLIEKFVAYDDPSVASVQRELL